MSIINITYNNAKPIYLLIQKAQNIDIVLPKQ